VVLECDCAVARVLLYSCYVFLVCALARVLLGGCILEQDKELTKVYIIFLNVILYLYFP